MQARLKALRRQITALETVIVRKVIFLPRVIQTIPLRGLQQQMESVGETMKKARTKAEMIVQILSSLEHSCLLHAIKRITLNSPARIESVIHESIVSVTGDLVP
jgi:hypothetical protein